MRQILPYESKVRSLAYASSPSTLSTADSMVASKTRSGKVGAIRVEGEGG